LQALPLAAEIRNIDVVSKHGLLALKHFGRVVRCVDNAPNLILVRLLFGALLLFQELVQPTFLLSLRSLGGGLTGIPVGRLVFLALWLDIRGVESWMLLRIIIYVLVHWRNLCQHAILL
jgi:hypothetical protein